MGGKKKAAQIAANTAKDASKVAEKRYEEARAGNMPSQAALMAKQQAGLAARQFRGAHKSARNPFQRALMARQGMRAAGGIQAGSLGAMASARAQEQLGLMGAAQGHQFGMISNQAQYQSSAHNSELAQAGIGAAGAAASGMI